MQIVLNYKKTNRISCCRRTVSKGLEINITGSPPWDLPRPCLPGVLLPLAGEYCILSLCGPASVALMGRAPAYHMQCGLSVGLLRDSAMRSSCCVCWLWWCSCEGYALDPLPLGWAWLAFGTQNAKAWRILVIHTPPCYFVWVIRNVLSA